TGVLAQAFRDGGGSVARVSITLSEPATYRIRPEPRGLLVSLSPGEADRAASAGSLAPPSSLANAARVQDVRFVHTRNADTVTVDFSAVPTFTSSNGPGAKSRVEIKGASLPKELERTLDLSNASTRV